MLQSLSKIWMVIITVTLFTATESIYSQNIDIKILRSVNSSADRPSDGFFKFASNSDAYIIAGIPVVTGVTALIKHDDTLLKSTEVLVGATCVNLAITTALKYTINRTRPFITYPDIRKKSAASSPSFPSGHTSGSFATATSISLSYPRWYVIVPVFGWAGVVAYSRMDLGVHYPSDILAGAIVGAGSAWLTHVVNKKLSRKPWEKPCNCPKF